MEAKEESSGAGASGAAVASGGIASKPLKPLEMPDDLYSLMQQQQAATEMLGRVVLTGAHSSAERCLEYVGDVRLSSLSGVHLVHRTASLTVLEGPSDDLREMLLRFFADVKKGTSPWTNVSVAGLSDSVASRLFVSWTQSQVSVLKEANLEQLEEDIVGFAAEVFVNAVGMGPALAELGCVDAVKAKQPQLFVSMERILAVANTDGVMKLADYEGLYGRPIESANLRDEVWPMNDITADLQIFLP